MKILTSRCGDLTLRGTPLEIERKYAALAYEAQRMGDYALAQLYFQHSENYKASKDHEQ